MATGHLEIMRTLVGLCTPSPQGEIVPFGPVREVLLELFGSSADHPDLVDCFHIALSVGGRDSPLIKEFSLSLFNLGMNHTVSFDQKFTLRLRLSLRVSQE